MTRLAARLAALEARRAAKAPPPPIVVVRQERGEAPAAFEARAARVRAESPPDAHIIQVRFILVAPGAREGLTESER